MRVIRRLFDQSFQRPIDQRPCGAIVLFVFNFLRKQSQMEKKLTLAKNEFYYLFHENDLDAQPLCVVEKNCWWLVQNKWSLALLLGGPIWAHLYLPIGQIFNIFSEIRWENSFFISHKQVFSIKFTILC